MNPAFLDEVQMDQKTPVLEQDLFRLPLREQINLKHPLVRLTELISWERLGRVDEEGLRVGQSAQGRMPGRARLREACRAIAELDATPPLA